MKGDPCATRIALQLADDFSQDFEVPVLKNWLHGRGHLIAPLVKKRLPARRAADWTPGPGDAAAVEIVDRSLEALRLRKLDAGLEGLEDVREVRADIG